METQNNYYWLVSTPVIIFSLVIGVLMIVALWKIFTKAGEAGWKSIIPFLNTFVLFRIAGLNPWLFLLMLIPFVNLVVWIVVSLKLGERFGKGTAWTIFMLIIFSVIGYLILGFGGDQYRRPVV
ncbi:MAG TPA: DUF5684 domain-containing protein [Micropruina sp.]|nr:DUF5684 domain-containing protein [Micropruina sp.]